MNTRSANRLSPVASAKFSLALSGLFSLAGCSTSPAPLAAIPSTQTATDIDPSTADAGYWLAQPAVETVTGNDFDTLWNAAARASRDLLFTIDREDRRSGVLTTDPSVSPQWFEPWRRELQTTTDVTRSSVATISRTLYFNFERVGDAYVVTPRVIVQRQAIVEHRVSGVLTRTYFRNDPKEGISGSRAADAGLLIPSTYWYALGRDELLEKELARRIRAQL